jgi:hypothetical protein
VTNSHQKYLVPEIGTCVLDLSLREGCAGRYGSDVFALIEALKDFYQGRINSPRIETQVLGWYLICAFRHGWVEHVARWGRGIRLHHDAPVKRLS